MTTDNKLSLAYGRHTYPDNVQAVWGARLIWPDDLLHDRQDLASNDDKAKMALIKWLNGEVPGNGAIAKMREALQSPYMVGIYPSMKFDDQGIIYEDDKGIIVGSCQQSYGYVYVAGWLK